MNARVQTAPMREAYSNLVKGYDIVIITALIIT